MRAGQSGELKYCELCGRPFVRPIIPEFNPAGDGTFQPRLRDCPECVANPPAEDEDAVVSIRSYRVTGIKMRL